MVDDTHPNGNDDATDARPGADAPSDPALMGLPSTRQVWSEIEELHAQLVERVEGANERYGAAQRMVREAQTRLSAIDDLYAQAKSERAQADVDAQDILDRAAVEADNRIAQALYEVDNRQAETRLHAEAIVAEAERRAVDADAHVARSLSAAEVELERLIEEANAARHARIDRLKAHESAIRQRITDLLDHEADVEADHVPEPVIDLRPPAETPAPVIFDAIDGWAARRQAR